LIAHPYARTIFGTGNACIYINSPRTVSSYNSRKARNLWVLSLKPSTTRTSCNYFNYHIDG